MAETTTLVDIYRGTTPGFLRPQSHILGLFFHVSLLLFFRNLSLDMFLFQGTKEPMEVANFLGGIQVSRALPLNHSLR